jgi:ABC-type nitrate/sulfonate/bicarbonate transport system substrate-binding protein
MTRLVQNVFLANAPTVAAQAIGAFSANGVDLVTTFTRSSLDQRAALVAGDADVAVTALDNLFAWNQSAGDGQFRAIAQIERTTTLPVYLAAGLTSLDQLAGCEHPRVVVDSPASGFGIALVAILESVGISPDRIEIVGAGGVNERLAALVAGEGDVALLAPFVAGAAADAGLRRVTAVEEAYPSYPGLVVAALQERADGTGAALTAYLAALGAGRAWLLDQPDAAAQALVATGLDEPSARAQLTLCGAGPMTVSRDGFAVVRELRATRGLLPDIPCAYDDFVTDRFLPIETLKEI